LVLERLWSQNDPQTSYCRNIPTSDFSARYKTLKIIN